MREEARAFRIGPRRVGSSWTGGDLRPWGVSDAPVTVLWVGRDEADRRTVAAAAPTPTASVQPQRPLFTARTDEAAGVISTRGHLDLVGADALCRIVTALQLLGHRRIVVRLGSTTSVDDDARALLAEFAGRIPAGGSRLVVR